MPLLFRGRATELERWEECAKTSGFTYLCGDTERDELLIIRSWAVSWTSHSIERMNIWFALAVDLVTIAVLGRFLYFRRHGRRDLLFSYVTLNVGVFAAMAVMMTAGVELAVGFGLFGVLAIIRLRSDSVTQTEVAYYFTAIALGLVNSAAREMPVVMAGLDLVLLAVVFAADHPWVSSRTHRQTVTLDVVHRNPDMLRADLEGRLGGRVSSVTVLEVDYVRDLMVVDVRFREGTRPQERSLADAALGVAR